MAIKLAKTLYNPIVKGKGFFMSYSDNELISLLIKIRSSKVMESMGFTVEETNKATAMMCLFYCIPTFDINAKLKEIIPNIESRLVSSTKIKNKDLPFLDLKNLMKGDRVVKAKRK